MAGELKVFSPEWCEAAMAAVNASEAMHAGFKDAASGAELNGFFSKDRAAR